MIRTFLIPLLAIAGVVMAVYTVVQGAKPPSAQPPVIEPPRAPYDAFVAGSGLIEPSSQNIAVGSPVGATVERVMVTVGDAVRVGQPLFKLDTRELDASAAVARAAVEVAQRELEKLRLGTRPELIPPARSRVSEAEASARAAASVLEDARAQLARAEQMSEGGGLSAEEVTRRRFGAVAAEARVAQAAAAVEEARAQLAVLEAGTWAADITVAEAQLTRAKAELSAIEVEIGRRTVASPVDGRVLQVNLRAGEFASAGATDTPLMIVGAVDPLHVRVDIDEHDAWRVKTDRPAMAYIRGNKDISMALTFVRYEPYVVPKRSLTGESTERVDTRVLQVLYRFDPKDLPVFVGQQVDVYIEADPLAIRSSVSGGDAAGTGSGS